MAVLAETSSPEAVGEVRADPAGQALVAALTEKARRVHQIAAPNVRRVGDVDKTRPGLFSFNYFTGPVTEHTAARLERGGQASDLSGPPGTRKRVPST